MRSTNGKHGRCVRGLSGGGVVKLTSHCECFLSSFDQSQLCLFFFISLYTSHRASRPPPILPRLFRAHHCAIAIIVKGLARSVPLPAPSSTSTSTCMGGGGRGGTHLFGCAPSYLQLSWASAMCALFSLPLCLLFLVLHTPLRRRLRCGRQVGGECEPLFEGLDLSNCVGCLVQVSRHCFPAFFHVARSLLSFFSLLFCTTAARQNR
mmetsp:Transcript_34227/g.88420  ORF Transcript_34227/g.88420 Transcript_34227/m.88420 type:complete len:207 (-) Transcript_34227:204-824(-)